MPTTVEVRDAALTLFASKGYNATSMRDVARATQMTPAAVYHHYESKDAILRDIMESGMTCLMGSGVQALAAAGSDPIARLRALVDSHVRYHGTYRANAIVGDTELRALSLESLSVVEAIRDRYEDMWRSVIEAIAAEHRLELDHALVRFAILQMCTGVAQWFRPDGALVLDKISEQFCDIAVRMLVNDVGERHGV